MDFSKLVLLSALLSHASCSPIGTGGLQRGALSSSSSLIPDAPVLWSDSGVAGHHEPHAQRPPPTSTSVDRNAVMKPIVGRDEGRAGPFDPALPGALQPRELQWGEGCTTSLPRNPSGKCSWDGTQTIYPSTTLRYASINCNGCDHVEDNYVYFCPNQRIEGTKYVSTAFTYWLTVCESSKLVAQRTDNARTEVSAATVTSGSGLQIQELPAAAPSPAITSAPTPTASLAAREDVAPAACPTTFVVQPEKSAGKTFTTYSSYTTTTVLLNCGGCPLTLTTALAGYGPAVGFTKTTTLPIGTKTTYACR
ncbi:hypothetical protein OQA88_9558 [Cercophora sp. LCS_1]